MNLKKLSIVTLTAVALVATSSVAAFAASAMVDSKAKVFEDPDTDSDRVDTLYAGQIVKVTDCDYGWCYVKHSGDDGWVKKNKLDFDYDDVEIEFGLFGDNGDFSFGFEISN